ncbi:MAG: OsmC family protein [Bacteroidota bacterium]
MEIILGENQKVIAKYKGFEMITDQPEKSGGDNTALSPFDLFMVSIGTCAGWYVKSFCQQRDLPEEGIRLTQKTFYNPDKKLIDKIVVEIHLPDDFPDKYRDALVKAASSCTVKKHMLDAPEFSIVTIK